MPFDTRNTPHIQKRNDLKKKKKRKIKDKPNLDLKEAYMVSQEHQTKENL